MNDNIISVKNLIKEYKIGDNVIQALDDVSLDIKKGDFVSIIGKSGSGKSTLMNILGFLDVPTSGNYYFEDVDTSTLKDSQLSKIRNNKLAFIFQSFNLISNLNAFQNVELPLIYRGVSKKERAKLVKKSLEMVGLAQRMYHKPTEMSGGQQQRTAIARAIATQTNLILADEPTGNLDSNSSKEIMDILKSLHDMGKTVIIITHDNEIARQTQRLIRISDGKVVEDIRQ